MNRILDFLRENALFLGLLAVLVVGYLALRQGSSSVGSAEEFDEALSTSGPVLVVFYSDT